jgi:hypothetical protein
VWYLLKVDALVATCMFAVAGVVIFALFVWEQARALAAARDRIYKRLSTLTKQPQLFANPLANSRSVSRSERHDLITSHRFQ